MVIESERAVACRGVHKSYGQGDTRVAALRGIDLEVRSGELLMLVGPSGCGKTTLISVIAGILDHDEGTCIVFGEDLKRMTRAEKTAFRGRNIGFVFQTYQLLPALSAAENVAVPLFIHGVPRRSALERAATLLERMGMAEKRNALPAQLSSGQQQRVAIARSLVHEPRLIVCDEPTSALDRQTGERVMELLRAVAVAPGRSLVVVTHDVRIFHLADRIAAMDDGRIQEVSEAPERSPHPTSGVP